MKALAPGAISGVLEVQERGDCIVDVGGEGVVAPSVGAVERHHHDREGVWE